MWLRNLSARGGSASAVAASDDARCTRPKRFKGEIAVVDASVEVTNSVIGVVMKQASVRSTADRRSEQESADRCQSNLPTAGVSLRVVVRSGSADQVGHFL